MLSKPAFGESIFPSVARAILIPAVAESVNALPVARRLQTVGLLTEVAVVAARVPVFWPDDSIITKSERAADPVKPVGVDVSASEPVLRRAGATETVAEIVSFTPRPPPVIVVVSLFVTSRRINAPAVLESPPTTVKEVCPLGPTDAARPVETALAGVTEDRRPKPKAATVTSATRLKVVFVDICFLSISRSREFPSFGFELIS
jgi:hypothetical protein